MTDDDKRWLKPFSTGLSCFDTVDGVCLTAIDTEEDCEKYCAEHPFCDNGYFIKYADKKYCVPLNGLTSFGARNAFKHSLFSSDESIFFHPDIGVSIKVFHDKKKIPANNFPAYIYDPFIAPTIIQDISSLQYLKYDLTLSTNKSDADKWQIFRFLYDFSGVNTSVYDRISNGEIISIRSIQMNTALFFHDNEFKLLPVSALMGYSPSFSYQNVYYFQLFQWSDMRKPIDPEQPFAIRINTLPITDKNPTFFLTRFNHSIKAEPVQDIEAGIEAFRTWRFMPAENDNDITSFPTSLFVKSQWEYARDYLGADLNSKDNKRLFHVGMFVVLVLLCAFMIRKLKRI